MILKFLYCIITEVLGGERFRSEGFTAHPVTCEGFTAHRVTCEGFTCDQIRSDLGEL